MAGGINPATGHARNDVWRFHEGDTAWSSTKLDVGTTVQNAEATVFSHLDGHLWILDNRGTVDGRQLSLVRVNPETGTVDTNLRSQPRWLHANVSGDDGRS